MSIIFAGVSPHPPIIIPEVGKGEAAQVDKTVKSMEAWAGHVRESGPETIVIITPHGVVFRDAIAITADPHATGDLGSFGAPELSFTRKIDLELVAALLSAAQEHQLPAFPLNRELVREYHATTDLDHGVLVPLYYLDKAGVDVPIVPIAMGLLPYEELYAFGHVIQEAADSLGRRVAVVASGDLSHRLTPKAPAGYAPEGAEFDQNICQALADLDLERLLGLPKNLVEKAGECGFRPIFMVLGSLDGYAVKTTIHSYEGPFGVGYLVAEFRPSGKDPGRELLDALFADRAARVSQRRQRESVLVRLARESLEMSVRGQGEAKPPSPLPPEMAKAAGVFVSIKKHGELRGCIGTIEPTQRHVAAEIMENAISAGTRDPRFDPVTEDELDDLVYSVDVLGEPEPIESVEQLDPERYGVIVRRGHRSGLLLPNLEGIESAEEQVAIARRKAGIKEHEPVELERFEVIRYY